jgi:hypothetical protein
MCPTINLYSNKGWDDNAWTRWEKFSYESSIKENELYHDKTNLVWAFRTYMKAIQNCSSVSFAYDHDNILYSIKNFENIDIINIDHHHDILYSDAKIFDDDALIKNLEWNYHIVKDNHSIHEGCWVGWLRSKDKIKSYTWITNQNAIDDTPKQQIKYFEEMIPRFKAMTKENCKIINYNFDHIHVCLSPHYVPKMHWHYFLMFIAAYEAKSGERIDLNEISNKRFQTNIRHLNVTNEILY